MIGPVSLRSGTLNLRFIFQFECIRSKDFNFNLNVFMLIKYNLRFIFQFECIHAKYKIRRIFRFECFHVKYKIKNYISI